MSNRLFFSALAAACACFLAFGLCGLGLSGIQTDEALFSRVLYPPSHDEFQLRIFGRDFSLMVMPYVGALKGYLWAPLLALWEPTAAVVRAPAVIIGAVSIWLFGLLIKRTLGPRTALAGAWLLATDPMYLLTVRWDWGPVAIQHLCLVGAMLSFVVFQQTRRVTALGIAGLLCGLGLWDKALFAWMLTGSGVAAAAIFGRKLKEAIGFRTISMFALGLLMGALPLIVYNIGHRGATLQAGEGWTAADLAGKAHLLRETLQGAGLYGYLVREVGPAREASSAVERALILSTDLAGRPHRTWLFWLVIVCAGAGLSRKESRRIVAFALLAGGIAWFWMALMRGTGGGTHHVILLWPLPQIIVAAACAAWPGRPLLLAVALTVLSQTAVTATYLANEIRYGSSPAWSDASYQLPDAIQSPVCVVDWGFYDTLRLLGQGRYDICVADSPIADAILRNEANLYVTHGPGEEIVQGSTDRLIASAAAKGYEPYGFTTLRDRHGRASIVLFRFRKAARAPP